MSEPSATPPASRRGSAISTQSGKSGTSASRRRMSINSVASRASGIMASVRGSFYGKRGKQAGESVETLRGSTGADFEGYATVHRGDGGDAFDCTSALCCKKKDANYFLLIKGYHCFVFNNEESKSPTYAIELINSKAVLQPSHDSIIPRVPHPGAGHDTTYTTIHLETSLGDVEYKLTFANMDDGLASKFCNAVASASNQASTEQVRKRLGHEGLLNKRGSVRYAEAIGAAKAKDQPDAPLGAGEILAEMPTPGY